MVSAARDNRRTRRLEEEVVTHVIDEAATVAKGTSVRKQKLAEIGRHVLKKVDGGSKHKIPLLPKVAQRAMEVANDPDVSIKTLEGIIQPDPMLTARVLAIANSPFYQRGNNITSLRAALMQMGTQTMRDVLYQTVAEAHIFRGASEAILRRSRLHGIAIAFLARTVFKELGIGIEHAFLCGMMHDVGRIILLQILEQSPPEGLEPSEYPEVIDLIHPHVGGLVSERWRIPALAREAARRHHQYQNFGDDGYSQVGHAIAATERLAEHVGLGDTPEVKPIPEEGDIILGELGFFEDRLTPLIEAAEKIREQLGQ